MTTSTKDNLLRLEDESNHYQRVSGLAVLGLMTGALSILALEHVAFVFIPVITVAINWRALHKISDRAPDLSGRPLALIGLALSLIFGLSSALLPLTQRHANHYQAIQLAHAWFTAMRQNQPDIAYECTLSRWMRVSEGMSVAEHYATASGKRKTERFITQPTIRMLLNLGTRASIRYCGNITNESDSEKRTIADMYSVTVGQGSEKTTCLLKLTIVARLDVVRKAWSWEVSQYEVLSKQPDGISAWR